MNIIIDLGQTGKLITPHWRVCVAGGRVAEALRADFQKHLEMVQHEVPFKYIRMHGIFHEDMMVYREENGRPILNWQYVDLVYDHWLSIGIRPFVELSFMPYDLASGTETVFLWKANISPPKDWSRWEWFVGQFISHVIERYGIDEVRQWYFEVWNEPNLDAFWPNADFEAYMQLYERTTRAIKAIEPALKVGGPASTGSTDKPGIAPWGVEFLDACAERMIPLDFFSTHPYPCMYPLDLEGKWFETWDGPKRLLVDGRGYEQLILQSKFPHIERHYTEWSSSTSARDPVHDSAFMASFIVQNNLWAQGLMDSLAYWVVSDIYEEVPLGDIPFHGGFGMVNIQGLKKPTYHGYWFLSRLGDELLSEDDSYIVTRRPDGTIVILLWNYCHYQAADSRLFERAKPEQVYELFDIQPIKVYNLNIAGLGEELRIQTTRFDREHGSVYDAWVAMGAPKHIRLADLEVLRQKMELDITVERIATRAGTIQYTAEIQPFGISLLEIKTD